MMRRYQNEENLKTLPISGVIDLEQFTKLANMTPILKK